MSMGLEFGRGMGKIMSKIGMKYMFCNQDGLTHVYLTDSGSGSIKVIDRRMKGMAE